MFVRRTLIAILALVALPNVANAGFTHGPSPGQTTQAMVAVAQPTTQ